MVMVPGKNSAGRKFIVVMIAGWLAALPGVLWAIEKLEFKPGFNLFSVAQDVEMGKDAAAQIDKQVPLLKDPETLRYASALEKKLIAVAPDNHAEYVWRVKIVNRPEINSFALPGGFIYVNRGLIEAAENEAQLAGALAHELGHVPLRHGTHMATETMLAQWPAVLLNGMLGQGGSLAGQLAQLGIGLGLDSLLLKNGAPRNRRRTGWGFIFFIRRATTARAWRSCSRLSKRNLRSARCSSFPTIRTLKIASVI